MPVKCFQVDAFTNKPFASNPAAVCLMPTPRDVTWMQQLAREMNLSETAFLHQQDDGFDLRWFTPPPRWIRAVTPPWPARTSCGNQVY